MTIVDARGLSCPLPLVLATRKMAELRAGERMVVLATDPEAPIDIPAWAARRGHGYSERRVEGWIEFTVVKSA